MNKICITKTRIDTLRYLSGEGFHYLKMNENSLGQLKSQEGFLVPPVARSSPYARHDQVLKRGTIKPLRAARSSPYARRDQALTRGASKSLHAVRSSPYAWRDQALTP
jgi:hypothetical protein